MKRRILSVILALTIICSLFVTAITAYAVATYSNTETEHIASLPSKTIDGISYRGVGGIAIGKNKNSMFVVKAQELGSTSTEDYALFYDFPDINNTENRHHYLLPMAGHANGMTIGPKDVYVCGWSLGGSNVDDGNTYNNWIVVIPRELISALRRCSDSNIYMDSYCESHPEVPKYYVMHPKTKTVLDDGSIEYNDYQEEIKSITLYNNSSSFIISYAPLNTDGAAGDIAYTVARIENYNGEKVFVVSEDPDDIFIVKNNAANKKAVGQDICYSSGNGLFIPKWYGKNSSNNKYYNPTKTVILWANIDGECSYKTIDGVAYRYYEPDRIVIDKSKEKDGNGEIRYTSFEPESIAFTKSGELLFSCNTRRNPDATGAYADSVFKLTHSGGQNFVLN